MSWRINFHLLSNEEYRKFSCSTEEDYRDKRYELVDGFGELIWSDTMTELIREDNASGNCLFSKIGGAVVVTLHGRRVIICGE